MKLCELCKGLARMYCESDNASLCWDCDAKVHSANFLAARHSRSLLCQVCQSPTAWSAAGAKLGKTVSVCDRCRCVDGYNYHRDEVLEESQSVNDEGSTGTEDEETDYEDEEDLQVVPWSSTPPPPPASSSSSEHSSNRNVSLKRMLEIDADLHSDDDSETSCCRKVQTTPSVEADGGDESTAVIDSFSTRMRSPVKIRRTETDRLTAPGCTAVIEFVRRNNRPRMIQGP
ncbi:hypothetical protein K7X08_032443 [Anisodus acutangulus]|uniref:B box-type domain-containing protein n=1 Tax=Anisodus acutangulus TaxID=402998 RepID=A0A9Q1RR05_9SOLA|nr:hypothetical protein K7X08_032443 [Anisodus acutangulus]